ASLAPEWPHKCVKKKRMLRCSLRDRYLRETTQTVYRRSV
ncbi:hypothetical protein CSUI_008275, partial [Cystoisospora suis]